MRKIEMVDLKNQYKKIKVLLDEQISEVINSSRFIGGNQIENFKQNLKKYLAVNHVITCGNGTDALQIALMSLDVKKGDEVITPSFSFIASTEVLVFLGIKPVLVDVDPYTFNISIPALKKAITPKTKAIIPVHLFGQCADMEEIMKIALENNLYVIEDNAQAIGADFLFSNGRKAKAGTIGDIGCTSFFPSKNLGCYGDGGAIFSNNDILSEKMGMIVNHGMKKKYYHQMIGINSRLDNLQAAILNVKLSYLDQYILARRKVADYYDMFFKDNPHFITPRRNPQSTHVFHQYTLITQDIDRDDFQNYLKDKQIPSMIYYPLPIHLQEAYSHLNYQVQDFPYSEKLSKHVISLPMHTELDDNQLEYICKSILNYKN